jgi:SAM-dependent methyltransferase
MHQSVIDWVAGITRSHDCFGKSILEVGSLDVNGSVRPLFESAGRYTGIDFRAGPGVDLVMNAHKLAFPDASFDVVISTEMLEHDDEFWISMAEMGRVLKAQGVLIITARGNGFMPHDYPADFWRFMPVSFCKLFSLAGCEPLEITEDWHPGHPGVFGFGKKI